MVEDPSFLSPPAALGTRKINTHNVLKSERIFIQIFCSINFTEWCYDSEILLTMNYICVMEKKKKFN
jgi:hypothetical protein